MDVLTLLWLFFFPFLHLKNWSIVHVQYKLQGYNSNSQFLKAILHYGGMEVTQSCPTLCDPMKEEEPTRLLSLSMEFSRQEYWSGLPFRQLQSWTLCAIETKRWCCGAYLDHERETEEAKKEDGWGSPHATSKGFTTAITPSLFTIHRCFPKSGILPSRNLQIQVKNNH